MWTSQTCTGAAARGEKRDEESNAPQLAGSKDCVLSCSVGAGDSVRALAECMGGIWANGADGTHGMRSGSNTGRGLTTTGCCCCVLRAVGWAHTTRAAALRRCGFHVHVTSTTLRPGQRAVAFAAALIVALRPLLAHTADACRVQHPARRAHTRATGDRPQMGGMSLRKWEAWKQA